MRMAAKGEIDVRKLRTHEGIPARGVMTQQHSAVTVLRPRRRHLQVTVLRKAQDAGPILNTDQAQPVPVDLQHPVFVAQQVPAEFGVDAVKLLHVSFLRRVAGPVYVVPVVMVAQYAVHPVLAPDLLKDIDVG